MSISKQKIKAYTAILRNEMIPAMGCTEPIAIAYCAAVAAKALGEKPERYEVGCSGNIIKNTMAVTVPQTGGQRGIEVAVLAGAIGGNADKELEVLADITPAQIKEIRREAAKKTVKVSLLNTKHQLHIVVDCYAGKNHARAGLMDTHTGIYLIEKNGKVNFKKKSSSAKESDLNYDILNIKDILAYADAVNPADIKDLMEAEIQYNTAISNEGLKHEWGASIGRTMIKADGKDDRTRMIARAAAGSDARMNGCAMPVVINSGSGNQGITVSMPVIEYADIHKISREKLYRALAVSNLTAIRQKKEIGRLSAFCGAVSAATGSVVGIAYLEHADYETISMTINNSLGTDGGMVCDGAKSSCAAKISCALQSAFLGYEMAKRHLGFRDGEGIIRSDAECTVTNVGRMAARGMKSTDHEILNIMLDHKSGSEA